MNEEYEYSPCEEYGHVYEDAEGRPGVRVCRDCNDEYEAE